MSTTDVYFIGVDVGSGSVRAALVNLEGQVLKTCVKDLLTWNPKVDYYEQSSNNIWDNCIHVIKNIVTGINPENIKGIGFDATCSLVALHGNGNPLSVSYTNNNEQNVIMWMDHRAHKEAESINKTNHYLLKYVGGKVSLEMEMPKLLWLKRNFPERWHKYGHFFDLPDFLTWRATGSTTRSSCSLICKWNYECSERSGWNVDYLREIGLEDLADNNFKKIGNKVLIPGEPCGDGLSEQVAKVLGLKAGTPVGTSIIDAHSGGLGMIGARAPGVKTSMSSRLSLICGTSTCHMAVSVKDIMVNGVWGPYFSAMVPKMWLNEAGQSASGMLIDYVISSHPAGIELLKNKSTGEVRYYLRELLKSMASKQNLSNVSLLTKDLHIYPDFHGNRSPVADPTLKGAVVGLTIDSSEESLALKYLATIQALAYGTRHIIESLVNAGYDLFSSILICGGLSKDLLFIQVQADSVGIPILKPHEEESVLIGAAILGACASNYFKSVNDALLQMGGTADVIQPDVSIKSFHDKKYRVYLNMLQDQLEYRKIMG